MARRAFPTGVIATTVLLLWGLTLVLNHSTPGSAERRAEWATPVESKYVKNFYKIDEGFYRSSQPSPEAFRELEAMGFTDILNFRSQNDDTDEARGTSLTLHYIPMNAGSPKTDLLVEALRIIRDRKGGILIHCWHGSDRTGIVTALYRILYQGWSKDAAIEELQYGGYGYHPFYKEIPQYIRDADIEQLRRMVEE